jgi:RimJ/RimL family protein N-acetyltransferase
MELKTNRLKLREFISGDLTALREMDSKPEMHKFERDVPSEADTQNNLNEYIRNQLEIPRTNFKLAITIPPQDSVKGLIKLSRQWDAIREWEVGWAIHPDEWGRGYAAEAAKEIMDWGFKQLNIHRIVAFCHVDNQASVRVMIKLGMHQDGRLRETRWLRGKWWDEYVYSVLEKEWR